MALTALLAGKTGQRALPPPAPDPVYGDSEPADLTPPGSPSGPGPCEDDAEVTAGSDEATHAAESSLLPSPTPCGAVAPPAAPPPPPPGLGSRVLVVSHTNAAVDRVLTGLLDRGFDDILRVGPLRRVHRSLLPHSLHAPAARGADVKSELEAMLRAAVSPAEAAAVREELARVRAGVLRRRRALLGTASGPSGSLEGERGLGTQQCAPPSTALAPPSAALLPRPLPTLPHPHTSPPPPLPTRPTRRAQSLARRVCRPPACPATCHLTSPSWTKPPKSRSPWPSWPWWRDGAGAWWWRATPPSCRPSSRRQWRSPPRLVPARPPVWDGPFCPVWWRRGTTATCCAPSTGE